MKTPEEMAEEYAEDKSKAYYMDKYGCQTWYMTERGRYSKDDFLAGYHTAYNIAYELGFEEALKAQKTLTYIQAEIKKNNENT